MHSMVRVSVIVRVSMNVCESTTITISVNTIESMSIIIVAELSRLLTALFLFYVVIIYYFTTNATLYDQHIKLISCSQYFTHFFIFLGLQGMDSTHGETRNALRVLTQKLIESKDTAFTSQGSGLLK